MFKKLSATLKTLMAAKYQSQADNFNTMKTAYLYVFNNTCVYIYTIHMRISIYMCQYVHIIFLGSSFIHTIR